MTFTFDEQSAFLGLWGYEITSRVAGLGVISLNKNLCSFNNNRVVEDYTTCIRKSNALAGFEQGTQVSMYDELMESPPQFTLETWQKKVDNYRLKAFSVCVNSNRPYRIAGIKAQIAFMNYFQNSDEFRSSELVTLQEIGDCSV